MNNPLYIKRLIDQKISRYLSTVGAISIVGPKWCGKSWCAKYHGNDLVEMDDDANIRVAKVNIDLLLDKKKPLVIDEWDIFPEIWDKVRHKCDEDNIRGKYILTCSTKLDDESEQKIHHSGAGRIIDLKMSTMTLYESLVSTGDISINDMYNNKNINKTVKQYSLDELSKLIIRGGFPGNINVSDNNKSLLPESYINSILERDIRIKKRFNKNKMLMLLKSLARNESTLATMATIINDIEEYSTNEEYKLSKNTVNEYMDILDKLHLIENQPAFSTKIRSKNRIGKAVKRHLTDVSLTSSLLGINESMLLNDIQTFGFLYEALVEHDLRIYMEYLDGRLFHFNDNTNGLEVDAILEFKNGEYAACEIKLGVGEIDDAINTLMKFQSYMLKKPKFMCIIVGNSNYIMRDKKTNIYILPITALKP